METSSRVPSREPGYRMSRETANKLYNVVLARAGLRGKDADKFTKEEELRFDVEFDKMPGEYRAYARFDWASNDEGNQKNAKSYLMDMATYMRITNTGGGKIMHKEGGPESELMAPNPGMPGYTYGVEMVDMYITPS